MLAGCSHRAKGRINSRDSNRHWMKTQWQVNGGGLRFAQGKAPQMEASLSGAPSQLLRCGSAHSYQVICQRRCGTAVQKIAHCGFCSAAARTIG